MGQVTNEGRFLCVCSVKYLKGHLMKGQSADNRCLIKPGSTPGTVVFQFIQDGLQMDFQKVIRS